MTLKHFAVAIVVSLMLLAPIYAQTPTGGTDRLGWTQVATSTELPQLTWDILVDGVRSSLTNVTCTPGLAIDTYECVAPYPPMTPGVHTIALIAIRTDTGVVTESPASASLEIRLIVAPATPTNLRNVK